ncbi:tRNA pseudouridine(38-40) synthase TruA [Ectobacillus antri]|jgi:tRNA pseudouridine38-40 synthase|uniref:tRNA pseudouridine synthase A n=1 Tax=Ectobacillus antri TaxID=2486280 RepID=A0ABT6H913_9BACI|nr:tRNA pseudouridine(38-40) synthase TruA [Ectobacillus antri]MDG4657896.1 tRNA pseudouridine(38-40) synthase TruA [Ectobacillus antri]MDG5754851.1 tRNA pseudouridine(38-40) synthase TruA [Ectobacillus antri]
MERIKCTISYDGTNFSGYQMQQKDRTVQFEIERALRKIHKDDIRTHASGRTDARVHAYGQVFHFDSPLAIPALGWVAALNSALPEDIAVRRVEKVHSHFHARYDVVSKEYRYKVLLNGRDNVFARNYMYRYPYRIDVSTMEAAAKHFLGTHDFTSFCSAKSDKENKVRTIHEIEIQQNGDELLFRFVGNGFLYNMVRIMVGTLLDVGQGRRAPADIPAILEKRDRRYASKTAPGHGLYLWQVNYNN